MTRSGTWRRGACCAAWLALGASVLGTLLVRARLHHTRLRNEPSAFAPESALLTETPAVPPAFRWRDPAAPAGSHGELFTPGELSYNALTDRYEAPAASAAAVASVAPLRLQLLSRSREAYPVQLLGHVGSGPTLRGLFELEGRGETIAAKSGHEFAGLGLTVVSVRVVRASASEDPGRRVAVAVLADSLSGERIELRSGETRWSGPPRVEVSVAGEDRLRLLREGERFEAGTAVYRVVRIGEPPDWPEVVGVSVGAPRVEWLPAAGGP